MKKRKSGCPKSFEQLYREQTGWNLKDCLIDMISNRGLSAVKAAKELGTSQSTVLKYVELYEIGPKTNKPIIVIENEWLCKPLVPRLAKQRSQFL